MQQDNHSDYQYSGSEVAIIGMAGRFPGAADINEFWHNLANGVESVSFISDLELEASNQDPWFREDPSYVPSTGGILKDIDLFDASFFGYPPVEAQLMDPQIRVFHECTYEVLENSGYDPEQYNGAIALYAGASSSSYWEAMAVFSGKREEFGAFDSGTLVDRDFLASRISYKLKFNRPQFCCSNRLLDFYGCRSSCMPGVVKRGMRYRTGGGGQDRT